MSSTTVVGYDGSPTAQAALGFAAERCGPDGRLIAVHVATAPSAFIDTPYLRHRALGNRVTSPHTRPLFGPV